MSKELNALEQVLVDTIHKVGDLTSQAIDFASDQIPDVIHQLLVYKLAVNLFYFIASIIFVVIFIWGWHKIKAWGIENQDDEPIIVYSTIGGVVSSGIIIHAMCRLTTILEIWLAPKLYLIEYAAEIMK